MSDNRDATGRIVTRDEGGTTTMTPEIAEIADRPRPLDHDWGYQQSKTIDDYEREALAQGVSDPRAYTPTRIPPANDLRTMSRRAAPQLIRGAHDLLAQALEHTALTDPALAERYASVLDAVAAYEENARRAAELV